MKKRKIFASLACSSLLVLALASCNNDNGGNTSGVDSDLEINEAYTALKNGEKVEFEFWHSFGDAVAQPLEDLVDNFEAEMKTKGFNITVKTVNKGGGYDGLRQAINLGSDSGAIPTLALGYPDHFADYIKQKLVMPLTNYVNNSNTDLSVDSNDFVESYWQENQMVINGAKQTVGLPFNKSTEIMCYNSNVVDKVLQQLKKSNPSLFTETSGYNEATGAWDNPTWNQVIAVGEYINNHKTDGTLDYTYGSSTTKYTIDSEMKYPVYIDSEANFFITTSRQWGGEGKYTVVDKNGKGTVVAWNDSTKEAMSYFMDAALKKKAIQIPTAGGTGSYGSAYMSVGKAFISVGSTAGVKNNNSNRYDMKVAAVPQKGYGETDTNSVIQQGTNLVILSKSSNVKQRVAAWLLMKYLTDSDNQVDFSSETGYLPVLKSSRNSDKFKELLASSDKSNANYIYTGAVAKGLKVAIAESDYYYTDDAFNGSSIARDKLAIAVQDMFKNGKTYDQAMTAYYTALAGYSITCKKNITE